MADPKREALREEYSVRVHAPREVVWEEMETVDLLLAHVEQVVHAVVDDQKVSATIRARFKWGPFGWNLNGVASVRDLMPPERLTFVVESPAVELAQRGVFDLVAVSADETNLTFVADFDLGRLASKVRSVVEETIEGYVRTMVTQIGARAERHWLAEQRLQQRFPAADER